MALLGNILIAVIAGAAVTTAVFNGILCFKVVIQFEFLPVYSPRSIERVDRHPENFISSF